MLFSSHSLKFKTELILLILNNKVEKIKFENLFIKIVVFLNSYGICYLAYDWELKVQKELLLCYIDIEVMSLFTVP